MIPQVNSSCPQCPHKHIGYGGDPQASIVMIGQSPGKHDKPGQPFSGYAARDLDYYLLPRVLRMDRDEIGITNVVECQCEQDAITLEQAQECARHHLAAHLFHTNIAVVMGAFANRVLGIHDLEREHGIPRVMELPEYGWCGVVLPIIHPAQSTHDAYALRELTEDFATLKALRDDGYVWREPMPEPESCENLYLPDPLTPIAIDTETYQENGRDVVHCVSYAAGDFPNLGWVLFEKCAIDEFIDYLNRIHHGPVVMHNASYDLPLLLELGLSAPGRRLQDTMVMAYNRGYGSVGESTDAGRTGRGRQSLKYLAYRLLRLPMTEFSDMCRPYWDAAFNEWVIDALMLDWPDIHVNAGQLKKNGEPRKPKYKPNPIRLRLERLLEVKEPLTSLGGWPESDIRILHSNHRSNPVLDVRLVPKSTLIEYAGKDAVATLGTYLAFLKQRAPRALF